MKKKGMEIMTMTTFTSNNVEWEPTTSTVQEIPVVIVTADAIAHEHASEIESTNTIKEIQTEGEVVHGIAHEFSLEVQTVSEFVPEHAFEIESISAVKEFPLKEETVCGISHEFSSEEQTVREFIPEHAFEIESVSSAVKEMPLEEEIVCGIVSELSLEEQTETSSELVPEIALELQNVSAVRDMPSEEEMVCGIASEQSVEEETASELVPEIPLELQNVSTVRDIPFEEEMVCGIAQELSLGEQTAVSSDSAVPEFACEIENISAVQEIAFEDQIVCGVSQELCSEQQTVSVSTHEFTIELEDVNETVTEIPLEQEMVNVIAHEVSTDITSVSPAVEPLNKVIIDVPLHVDSSAKESSTSISLETKAIATPDEKSSAKSCSLGLNAEAREFIPQKTRFPELASFNGVSDGGAAAVKNREKTGADGEVVEPVRLNVWAKEFIPSSGGVSGRTAAVPTREDTGSATSQRSLNVFAREFVPSNFHNNAAVHPNHSNAPTMAPVYRPAAPRTAPSFRSRSQAGIQHRLPSGRFLPHHPRVRPRFQGDQQVSPHVMRPRWSTTDR